jgi:hypothetical protein
MADKSQVMYDFWSQFGLDAHDENSVPDEATMPYITYNTIFDSLGYPVQMYASLWYRSSSWVEISQKAEQISDTIGYGGKVMPMDTGYVWITRGTPFAQRMPDDYDDMVRRVYLNIEVEFLSN